MLFFKRIYVLVYAQACHKLLSGASATIFINTHFNSIDNNSVSLIKNKLCQINASELYGSCFYIGYIVE